MITEYYGVNLTRKAIFLALCNNVILVISTNIAIWYDTIESGIVDNSIKILFPIDFKIIISLMVIYFIPLIINTFLYESLIGKNRNRRMWLRNFISSIICCGITSTFFIAIACAGTYSIKGIIVTIAIVLLIETTVIWGSTPFLYLIKYLLQRRLIRKRW